MAWPWPVRAFDMHEHPCCALRAAEQREQDWTGPLWALDTGHWALGTLDCQAVRRSITSTRTRALHPPHFPHPPHLPLLPPRPLHDRTLVSGTCNLQTGPRVIRVPFIAAPLCLPPASVRSRFRVSVSRKQRLDRASSLPTTTYVLTDSPSDSRGPDLSRSAI